jgi:PAS domain S-box-containing protein
MVTEARDRQIEILLVEDNPADARLIQESLRETPGVTFEVRHADRLATGLAILAATDIDVVLLDLGLPDASGLDTIVRAHRGAEGVPIVVLTGLDDEDLAMRAVQEGAQDYLIKGVHGDLLVRAIRYAIERKRTQGQLRQSQDQLRTIIYNTPIILFAADPEGRLTISEGRGLEGLGVQPGEVNGQSIFDLFAHQQDLIEPMRRALSGEEAAATVRLNSRAFDLHVAPLREDTSDVRGIIGVSTDITERVQAEEALRETLLELEARNLELESFTYSVSHDLKEPLRTLEAFSQFVLEDYASVLDDQGRDYLTRMGKAAGRMKQMIEELLMLSRLSRRPHQIERVSVSTVVSNAIAAMQAFIEQRNGRIEVIGELPDIGGDVTRVEQIFGNLIGNGLKFNQGSRPTIEIGVSERRDGQAVIFVRDNGIGIEQDYQAKIFGVFQRLHRREDYEGTGAGLAIVKRAAEAMSGSVWLESTPGRGSTFFVALPLWEDALVGANAAA